jgi:hypothetical protein
MRLHLRAIINKPSTQRGLSEHIPPNSFLTLKRSGEAGIDPAQFFSGNENVRECPG